MMRELSIPFPFGCPGSIADGWIGVESSAAIDGARPKKLRVAAVVEASAFVPDLLFVEGRTSLLPVLCMREQKRIFCELTLHPLVLRSR
jgi:hypothetical protein